MHHVTGGLICSTASISRAGSFNNKRVDRDTLFTDLSSSHSAPEGTRLSAAKETEPLLKKNQYRK